MITPQKAPVNKKVRVDSLNPQGRLHAFMHKKRSVTDEPSQMENDLAKTRYSRCREIYSDNYLPLGEASNPQTLTVNFLTHAASCVSLMTYRGRFLLAGVQSDSAETLKRVLTLLVSRSCSLPLIVRLIQVHDAFLFPRLKRGTSVS